MANPTFYHYPNCSTCKKAEKWLAAQGIDVRAVHLVEKTPSAATLKKIHKLSGQPVKKLFNTSGQSYRQGGFSDKLKDMSLDDALSALAADGMLIKRPLLVSKDRVLIGFKEAEWSETLL